MLVDTELEHLPPECAGANGQGTKELSQSEALVLMCIAYFQPITRGELSSFFGKEVSRDLIGVLRAQELIASGPRSPQPGAPHTYVTTKKLPIAVRARHAAPTAGFRGARGCRTAVEAEATGRGHHARVFRSQ